MIVLLATGALASTPPASAAAASNCGSVSYTTPGTHNEGRAALNNLTARGVSCRTARMVAKTFLAHNTSPKGWHATSRTVVSRHNAVDEEIFSKGLARVVGDVAN
jgi:hypothetical protein